MKRVYNVVVLLALVNFFAVVGLVAYLFTTGQLDAERMAYIGLVFRDKLPVRQAVTGLPVSPPITSRPSDVDLVRKKTLVEIELLTLERQKRELEDCRRLNELIGIEIDRKLVVLQQQQKAFLRERGDFHAQVKEQGFARTLEMLSSVDPAIARDLLMRGEEFNDMDVVRLMMAMDDFKARKIVNTCKSEEQLDWMRRILAQIHNLERSLQVDGRDRPVFPGVKE